MGAVLLAGVGCGHGCNGCSAFGASTTAQAACGLDGFTLALDFEAEFFLGGHEAAIKDKRQNAFDDFIAAAEWLIAQKITRPDRLAINGGSNGGLLVGAVLNQRPELFGAAVPQVGVMDMLRFHKFTIGWAWASDYGSFDDPGQFKALLAYSPLHTPPQPGSGQAARRYPPVLVTTADHDDRVVPAHSFKYAAALQAANTGPAAKLIRIETEAGHGVGKPTSKLIEDRDDVLAFIANAFGIELKAPTVAAEGRPALGCQPPTRLPATNPTTKPAPVRDWVQRLKFRAAKPKVLTQPCVRCPLKV